MMDAMVCVTQIRFDLLQKLLWGEDDENVKRGACKVDSALTLESRLESITNKLCS